MKTCFFIGHREVPGEVQGLLDAVVERLVLEDRVSEFIVGRYGDFDRMAVCAVQKVIREHPEREVTALMLEPYFPGDRDILVPHYFDAPYYPEGLETVPRRYCIEKANQKALDMADVLVVWVCRDGGNAAKILRRGRRREKQGDLQIINLAEPDICARIGD